MNEKPNNSEQENLPTQTVMTESAGVSARAARRSMLKKSIGLAPVVLTLASRPVLAQFKSPSAWGSEQLMPAGASRHATPASFQTWTVSDWAQNKSRGLLGKPWKNLDSSYEDMAQLANLTVGEVLTSRGLTVPSDVSPSVKMLDLLQNGSPFQKTTVVAQLNARCDSSVSALISLETLRQMANGSFSPPHLSVAWDKGTIARYLHENAVASLL